MTATAMQVSVLADWVASRMRRMWPERWPAPEAADEAAAVRGPEAGSVAQELEAEEGEP